MKKKLLTLVVLLVAMTANIWAQRVFNHPGSILGKADLERIKLHVAAGDEPWASCWKSLQADNAAKPTYTASASAEIGGSNGTRQRAAADAYAAMMNAIEWHVTGKTAYADCAARILTAWGTKLETASAELYQYPCRAMIVAAEMLRYSDGSFYEGWGAGDRTTFLEKVRTVMYPACKQFCTYQNTHPSWYTPCALAVMAAGVLLDDATIYQEGYNLMLNTDHWDTMYGGSIEPSGQMREMGRDNVHGGLTLGDIAQACLVAWNQGDDLFGEGGNRLLKGMEYWCRYNTGHTDTPFEPQDCSGLDNATGYSFYYISTHNNGFRLQPDACCFEAVYHHYKEVKGMDAEKEFPYLTIAARLARPDTNNQMLGYGTLFFTVNADASPFMTTKPQQPTDFRAEDGYKCIYLSWQHPEQEDARGFRLFRSTDGTSFTLLKTWDYYTNNQYKDEDVEPGKKYYYKVQLTNKAGYSEQSAIASATVQSGSDALPKGWNYAGVSSEAYGGGLFTMAQDSTFTVSGLGNDIGGTSDMHGFVYKKLTGDGTITVRLTSTDESFYKVGILMRGTLAGNSQRVGMTLGETGCRMLRMCTRSADGSNTSWINGTNYGRAPFWMRISRKGNVFTTFISRDNDTWHQIGRSAVAMPQTYYVGMASCNRNTSGSTYQAVFDHVSVIGTEATPTSVPNAPTGLTLTWTGTRQASLSWNDVAEADSFIVYRSAGALHFDSIATVRTTHYSDTAPLPGKYYYNVAALNAAGIGTPCTAGEITLYEAEQLRSTIIGTNGSYKNNSSTTKTAALDGNMNTFFDAAEADGAWVGYDMGENDMALTAYVKYAPRSNYPNRMTGGKFQVSMTADFSDAITIATVPEAPATGVLTQLAAPYSKGCRYLRYLSPNSGNCNVAEVQFFGTKVANPETGVRNVSSTITDAPVYTIGGVRVTTPASGQLYIQTGKKHIKK